MPQHDRILLGIGDKVLGGRQIDRVVIGIAALLEIVDVIGAILIIRHRIADIPLHAAVLFGQEEGAVGVGVLLAARGTQRGKVRLVFGIDERFAVGRGRYSGSLGRAGKQQHSRQKEGQQGQNSFLHNDSPINSCRGTVCHPPDCLPSAFTERFSDRLRCS